MLVEVLTCKVVSTLPPRGSCLCEDSKPLDIEFLCTPYSSLCSTVVVSISTVGGGELLLLLASSCPLAYPIAALLLTIFSVSRLVRSASLSARSFSRCALSALRIASCIFLSSSASRSSILVSLRIVGDGDRRGVDLLGTLLGVERCFATYVSTRETQVLVKPTAWFW